MRSLYFLPFLFFIIELSLFISMTTPSLRAYHQHEIEAKTLQRQSGGVKVAMNPVGLGIEELGVYR
jgi:hypothetical protein